MSIKNQQSTNAENSSGQNKYRSICIRLGDALVNISADTPPEEICEIIDNYERRKTERENADAEQSNSLLNSDEQNNAINQIANSPNNTLNGTTEESVPLNEQEISEIWSDYNSAASRKGQHYLYHELGLNLIDVDAFVGANITAADKMLERIKSEKPVIGLSIAKYKREMAEWQKKVEIIQKASFYWHGIKNERTNEVL